MSDSPSSRWSHVSSPHHHDPAIVGARPLQDTSKGNGGMFLAAETPSGEDDAVTQCRPRHDKLPAASASYSTLSYGAKVSVLRYPRQQQAQSSFPNVGLRRSPWLHQKHHDQTSTHQYASDSDVGGEPRFSRSPVAPWVWDASAPEFQPQGYPLSQQSSHQQTPPVYQEFVTTTTTMAAPRPLLPSWYPVAPGGVQFLPDYVTFVQDDLYVGGTDGELLCLYGFGEHGCQSMSLVPLTEPSSSSSTSRDASWRHIGRIDPVRLLGVSRERLHVACFEGPKCTGRRRDFGFIDVPKDPTDRISSVSARLRSPIALGTEHGLLYLVDLDSGQHLRTLNISDIPSSFSAVKKRSNLQPYPVDSVTCGLTDGRCYSQQQQSPLLEETSRGATLAFGTSQGKLVLLDERLPGLAGALELFSGPVLGLAQCNWEVIAVGVNWNGHQYAGSVSLDRPMDTMASPWSDMRAFGSGWSTGVALTDIRMFQSPRSAALATVGAFQRSNDVLRVFDVLPHPRLSHTWLGLEESGDIITFEVTATGQPRTDYRLGTHLPTLSHMPLHKIPHCFALWSSTAVLLDTTGTLLVTKLDKSEPGPPATQSEHCCPNVCVVSPGDKREEAMLPTAAAAAGLEDTCPHFRDMVELTASEDSEPDVLYPYDSGGGRGGSPPSDYAHSWLPAASLPPFPSRTTLSRRGRGKQLCVPPLQEPHASGIRSHSRHLRTMLSTLEDIERTRRLRPPVHMRLLPTTAALESIATLRHVASSSGCSSVLVDPIEVACWQRDVQLVGYSIANALNPEAAAFLSWCRCRRRWVRSLILGRSRPADLTDNGRPAKDFMACWSTSAWTTWLAVSDLKALIYRPEATLASFNMGGLAGLEPSRLCPMVNAVVQVLRFVPGFGTQLLRHHCDKSSCLACEMGLLWHMLDLAQLRRAAISPIALYDVRREKRGRACQAKNLLYAFSAIPEVRLCKILPDPDDPSAEPEADLENSAVVFLGFLLQHLRRELGGEGEGDPTRGSSLSSAAPRRAASLTRSCANLVDSLFGCQTTTTATCTVGSHDTTTGDPVTKFIIDLCRPSVTETVPASQQFLYSLKASLERRFTRSAFCQICGATVKRRHQQKITCLPPILALNCRAYFAATSNRSAGTPDSLQTSAQAAVSPSSMTTMTPLLHNGFPSEFWICCRGDDGSLELQSEQPSDNGSQWKHYCLLSTVFVVRESVGTKADGKTTTPVTLCPDHLVAHIRVASSTIQQVAQQGSVERRRSCQSSQELGAKENGSHDHADDRDVWIAMNDLVVTSATLSEVFDATSPWKRLSCLIYCCADALPTPPPLTKCPIPTAMMLKNTSLSRHPTAPRRPPFTPFTMTELERIMSHGCLLSLDAEFVMSRPSPDLREDTLSLARLSVVRGDGPLEGIPCLDCYILAHEEPIDYLTKFSGLRPGDLDPNHSQHWLTTRKTMYQKLRFLLDHQFLGHGLSKDFSIINLFVPESQLIDTAELFRLPGRRYLSLRFLARHVLHKDIQFSSQGHDSVEDATVALELYKQYVELQREGKLATVLKELYTIGRSTNWAMDRTTDLALTTVPAPSGSFPVYAPPQQPCGTQEGTTSGDVYRFFPPREFNEFGV